MAGRPRRGTNDYGIDSQQPEAKVQNRDAIALVVVASLASMAPAAEAQMIFKCKDAAGNVTYTEVPCLRSETSSVVDTSSSSNAADFSSIRKEVGRIQSQAAQAAAVRSQPSAPEPPPPPPEPSPPPVQRSGY